MPKAVFDEVAEKGRDDSGNIVMDIGVGMGGTAVEASERGAWSAAVELAVGLRDLRLQSAGAVAVLRRI